MIAPDPRLPRYKQWLRDVARVFALDISVIAWDGEAIPLCAQPSSDLALHVRDPGVLTSALRSPRVLTLVELLLNGRIRIVNGTFFDFEPRRQDFEDKLRAGLWRKLDKRLAFQALTPFLFGAREPTPELGFAGAVAGRPDQGRDDKALVQFHYDLSNDFYALFLDPQMVYSCAYFPTWEASLEEAQTAKLDLICRKLQLRPGEKFLDIGCGWCGLVIHAARHYGVIAHGVTLRQPQLYFGQR